MSSTEPILKRVYWIHSDSGGQGERPDGLISQILPLMNHQSQLYLITEDPIEEWEPLLHLLNEVKTHLLQWGFCQMNLRPVHPVSKGRVGSLQDLYRVLLKLGESFHQEALRHQIVSRWMVLPVLRAMDDSNVKDVLSLARFLRERMMIPTFSFPQSPRLGTWVKQVDTDRERIVLEQERGPTAPLFFNDLFDELLQWSQSSGGGFSWRACASLIVDTVKGAVGRCPVLEKKTYSSLAEVLREDHLEETCVACWHTMPERIKGTLRWNFREKEGRRVEHQLGVYALSRGDLDHAGEHFRALVSSNATDEIIGDSLFYLGILHFQLGELQEAHRALTEARARKPQSGSVLYHLGRCEFAWRDYIAAADLFTEALRLGVPPETGTDVRLYLGISHIHLEEFEEALRALESAEGELPSILFYRAMALLGLGFPERALEGFQGALARQPETEDLASVHFYIGHCLKEMDRWEEAISPLQTALHYDPQSYEAWNLLGFCFFRLAKHRDAIQAFLKALEINPRSAIDHANIGSNFRDLEHWEEALTWYRKALDLDPTLGFAAQNAERIERILAEGNEKQID